MELSTTFTLPNTLFVPSLSIKLLSLEQVKLLRIDVLLILFVSGCSHEEYFWSWY